MCTAVSWLCGEHYFGRNLDLEYSYRESVTVTPRCFPLRFRHLGVLERHHAMIGMAYVQDGYPLYYEGTNEMGLSAAGLNFPESAAYQQPRGQDGELAAFELIPWLLGRCATVAEAVEGLGKITLTSEPFSAELPAAPLHWLLADRESAVVVEACRDGLHFYPNPVGVLTNEPPFPMQQMNLRNYLNLTPEIPVNRFADGVELKPYSRGMGAFGLPGDLSSQSRFVRAAFLKCNSLPGAGEAARVSQFFHILNGVAQQRGCVRLGEGQYERTIYSCCCNTFRGIYYYQTYENPGLTAVELHREQLDGTALKTYPMRTECRITREN